MSAPAAPHLPAPLPFPPLSLFENKEHTVSHALAQNSSLSPKKAALKLFPKPWFFKRFYRRFYIKYDLIHVSTALPLLKVTQADSERATGSRVDAGRARPSRPARRLLSTAERPLPEGERALQDSQDVHLHL